MLPAPNESTLHQQVRNAAAAVRRAAGSEPVAVAVLPVGTESGQPSRFSAWLERLLITELAAAERPSSLVLVERAELNSVERELGLSSSLKVDDSSAKSAGAFLGADQVLVCDLVRPQPGRALLAWRLVAVEAAAAVGAGSAGLDLPPEFDRMYDAAMPPPQRGPDGITRRLEEAQAALDEGRFTDAVDHLGAAIDPLEGAARAADAVHAQLLQAEAALRIDPVCSSPVGAARRWLRTSAASRTGLSRPVRNLPLEFRTDSGELFLRYTDPSGLALVPLGAVSVRPALEHHGPWRVASVRLAPHGLGVPEPRAPKPIDRDLMVEIPPRLSLSVAVAVSMHGVPAQQAPAVREILTAAVERGFRARGLRSAPPEARNAPLLHVTVRAEVAVRLASSHALPAQLRLELRALTPAGALARHEIDESAPPGPSAEAQVWSLALRKLGRFAEALAGDQVATALVREHGYRLQIEVTGDGWAEALAARTEIIDAETGPLGVAVRTLAPESAVEAFEAAGYAICAQGSRWTAFPVDGSDR